MHVGLGMKGQITVSSTGIAENSNVLKGLSVFPIPATEKININYSLIETGLVSIGLIGLNGQQAATLVNEVQVAGKQQKAIAIPSNLASGLYFVQITLNGRKAEERLISIK